MDPYLEGSEWGSLHVALCAEIARQLAPQLRPRYIVRTMRRFVTDSEEDVAISAGPMYPDVGVTPRSIGEAVSAWGEPPLHMTLALVAPEPRVAVEIRDASGHGLVTALELLSLANKRGDGRAEYLARRQRLLHSAVHLVEIDLLRSGRRLPLREPLPPAAYFAYVSRADQRPVAEVWPIRLEQPLPTIPIPLRAPDPDAALDLQAALTAVYDDLGYDLAIDYRQPPEVPLDAEAAQWARRRLQDAGFSGPS